MNKPKGYGTDVPKSLFQVRFSTVKGFNGTKGVAANSFAEACVKLTACFGTLVSAALVSSI